MIFKLRKIKFEVSLVNKIEGNWKKTINMNEFLSIMNKMCSLSLLRLICRHGLLMIRWKTLAWLENFMLSYYFTWLTFNKSFYLNSHKSKIALFFRRVELRLEEYVNSIMLFFFFLPFFPCFKFGSEKTWNWKVIEISNSLNFLFFAAAANVW